MFKEGKMDNINENHIKNNQTPNDLSSEQFIKSIKKAKIIINETLLYTQSLLKQEQNKELFSQIIQKCNNCSNYLKTSQITFENIRIFIDQFYYMLLNNVEDFFIKTIIWADENYFTIDRWQKKDKLTLFFANYILMHQNFRLIKEIINESFINGYKSSYELIVDENSPLWDVSEMKYIEFPSDKSKIRDMANHLINNILIENTQFSKVILEEQISEIIKNATIHGNKNDLNKKVKVWYLATKKMYKIIVEDEGEGFVNFDEWNEFNRKRNNALSSGNMEETLKYIQYRGPHSTDEDGGNSLFAALEYWDSSLVYNEKKNKVVAVKYLH